MSGVQGEGDFPVQGGDSTPAPPPPEQFTFTVTSAQDTFPPFINTHGYQATPDTVAPYDLIVDYGAVASVSATNLEVVAFYYDVNGHGFTFTIRGIPSGNAEFDGSTYTWINIAGIGAIGLDPADATVSVVDGFTYVTWAIPLGYDIPISANYDITIYLTPGPVDPSYSDVQALLYFEGADGGSTFTDEKGHTFAVNAGSPVTSTTAPPFGTSSGHFPAGNNSIQASAFTTDFAFTTIYTLEFWIKLPSLVGTGAVLCWYQNGAPSERYIYFTGGKLVFNNSWNGAGALTMNNAPTADTWQHVAVCSDNIRTRIFLDGVLDTNSANHPNAQAAARKLQFGANASTGGNALNMYLSNFRFTPNVARYTAAFQKPIAPFPNI